MLGKHVNSRDNVQVGVMFNAPGNGRGITLFNDQASAIALGDVVLIGYDPDGSAGLTQGMQALAPATSTFVVFTAIAMEAVAVDAIVIQRAAHGQHDRTPNLHHIQFYWRQHHIIRRDQEDRRARSGAPSPDPGTYPFA